MRLTAGEKYEIIQQVTTSELGVKKTLRQYGISRSTFYNWYNLFLKAGYEGLQEKGRSGKRQWNRIPDEQKDMVVEIALEHTGLSSRELAHHITDNQGIFISESSVYRILKSRGLITAPSHILIKAADEFSDRTDFVHQMWQTDFTYFSIVGWGWYYLSTVLDDYSRYIIHWELCDSMKAEDVKRTIDSAIEKARIKSGKKPKLLSDNGACYVSSELRDHLRTHGIPQVHGRPAHPQTQGKIERYHRTMKNIVKLDNYYAPGELENAIEKFVLNYNNKRYHESLDNLTPADVYFGRAEQIKAMRKQIKNETIRQRKLDYRTQKILSL